MAFLLVQGGTSVNHFWHLCLARPNLVRPNSDKVPNLDGQDFDVPSAEVPNCFDLFGTSWNRSCCLRAATRGSPLNTAGYPFIDAVPGPHKRPLNV